MNKKGTRTEREQGQKAGKRKDKKDMICTFFFMDNIQNDLEPPPPHRLTVEYLYHPYTHRHSMKTDSAC